MSSLITRRTLMQSGVTGLAVMYGLSGCGDDDESSGGGGGGSEKASGTVSFGSNYSDPVPKGALQEALDMFQTDSGVKVDVNTVDHNTFQEQINNYLQGTPDDVFTWFAGYRMQFFAQRGLATDISDVWEKIGGNFSEAFKKASTGLDGKQYFVPFYNYPWAIFYKKSVWKKNGYEPAANLDDFKALCEQIKKDGMTPIAFGDKDGWPAMGTFDYLNMRTNGYDFHVQLMAGEAAWDGPEVKSVFETWRELLPYHAEGSLGRTWQDAAQTLNKDSAMYLLGSFVGQQFEGESFEDLDFFPFPEINPTHGTDTVEAPIDGYMMAKKPSNQDGALKLLEYLSSAEPQLAYLKADPTAVATNQKADQSGYSALQKKVADTIKNAKHITQFLDRDTDPGFASEAATNGLIAFIKDPNSVDSVLKGMADQAKNIFK